jgi:polyisoprenoid-binding protein YceI
MPTTQWNLDQAHSVAEFQVKHMMIAKVRGQFAGRTTSPWQKSRG